MARRLVGSGCDLGIELPTPNGRTCDFQVDVDGRRFFLHVKCLQSDDVPRRPLPGVLRSIEQVKRPFLVEVDWHDELSDRELADFAAAARDFVAHARIGEELLHRDSTGHPAGSVRITTPLETERAVVAVANCKPSVVARVGRLLERAYVQFMPGGENVILVMTQDPSHERLVDLALLGTHVERWDKIPRTGKRVAHGRAEDGFWTRGRFDHSRVVGWMQFDSEEVLPRLWFRHQDVPGEPIRSTIINALGAE